MDEHQYKAKGIRERWLMCVAQTVLWLGKRLPRLFVQDYEHEIDIYASSMTGDFNWLHNIIYPRFFEKIHVEAENLEQIRELAKSSTIIYVTKDIGQLEYNFFNYLFINELLPLASFVNELSLWQWLPLKSIRQVIFRRSQRFIEHGPLPHPISSGYAGAMVDMGKSLFIQLKSTEIFNDLYWYSTIEDPLASVISASERSAKPIYIVPLHFLWDKRPEGSSGIIVHLLPERLQRMVMFFKNCKNKAIVKISPPIALSDTLLKFGESDIAGKSKKLRKELLELLHQEKKVTTGPALKPRSVIINEIIEDPELQKVIYEVATEKGKNVDDSKALAKKYACEIASDVSYTYVENGCRIMKWVLKNIYDGIDINTDGLATLKKALATAPIILVPNHRSHMDYLILSTILYECNITIPHIAAGINLSFWPLGHIFRRCGAFFLRRTFAGNRLYRTVLKTYLKILLKEGYCQELFIEGGRSRTGKLLRPRSGFLSMVVEAIKEGATKEVNFVPVSITYDQVIEEYKKEIDGGEKKKERTRDLLHLGKHLKKRYGKIYVRFGEPISYSNTGLGIKEDVYKIASSVCATINKGLIATPSAAVALSALNCGKRGLTEDELKSNLNELTDYLKWKGVSFSQDITLENSIEKLVGSNAIKLHKEFEPHFYEITDESRRTLDYYKNNIVHFFVSAGCIASILLSYSKRGLPRPSSEEICELYMFCKSLFAFEFSFSTKMPLQEHVKKVLAYFDDSKITTNPTRLTIFKDLIVNFLESYLIVLNASINLRRMEEKVFLKTIIKYARHLHLLGRITRFEAISTPVFNNAILWLTNEGVLVKEEDKKGRKFYSFSGKSEEAEKLKLKLQLLA